MKLFAIAAAAAGVALSGGCNLYFNEGGHNSPPPADDDAPPPSPPSQPDAGTGPSLESEFVENVYPILEAKCAACHVGPPSAATPMFLGTSMDPIAMYAAVMADKDINGCFDPSQARLITKGIHEGPDLNAGEVEAIAAWLDGEAAAGATDPGCVAPPSGPVVAIEEQWAACESVSSADLVSTGAAKIATAQSTDGTCASCHGVADANDTALFGAATPMLRAWETQYGLEEIFEVVVQADGSERVQFALDKLTAKGTEQVNNLGTHPAFALTADVIQAMTQFTADVQAHEDAGQCPPPGFGPY